jgi:hypothetical protein
MFGTIKLLDLDEFGVLDFKIHNTFDSSLHAVKLFDNGYGVSVICTCYEIKPKGLGLNMNFPYGDWEKGTYEVACVVGDDEETCQFIIQENLEEEFEEYSMNGGILGNQRVPQIKQIMHFVKSLPSRKV